MTTTVKRRALMSDLPKGISIYRDKSGPDSKGNRKAGYFVRVGKKFSGQKPTRKFVRDLKEAGQYIAGLKPHAETIRTSQLSPKQIADCILCLRTLEEKETTLSLRDAVDLALRYHDPEGGRRTIKDVSAEMIARSKSRKVRDSSLRQLTSLLKGVETEFGDRLLATITTIEIEDWLDESEWSARTRNNYLKQTTQLYGYSIKRRYAVSNPCDAIDPAIEEDSPPGILTPAELRKLLDSAKQGMPHLLPFIAMSAFGWLRRSEICLLKKENWRQEDDTIQVKAAVAKTRKNRFIPVNDTLKAWLEACELEGRERFTRSPNADVTGDHLASLAKLAGVIIPHNALRHSSISYALAYPPTQAAKAMVNTAGEMAKHSGNSEQVIYQNYRALVPKSAGIEWWATLP
jgi:integrase